MAAAPSRSTPQQLTNSPLPPTPQQQLLPRRRHQSTNQIAGWTLQVNHADQSDCRLETTGNHANQSDCRLDTTGKSTPTNQIAGWTHHADQSDCRLDTTHLNHADQSDCRLDITSNQAGQSDCFMYCTLYFVRTVPIRMKTEVICQECPPNIVALSLAANKAYMYICLKSFW